MTNKQIVLAARPVGFPKDSDFKLIESPIPNAGDGQILVQSIFVSVDPYMRGRMNDVKSYAPPVAIGGVETIGRLLFTDYLFPFELTSVLLLAAMVGVLLLARRRA